MPISATRLRIQKTMKSHQLKHDGVGSRNQGLIGCLSRDVASCALLQVECLEMVARVRVFPNKMKQMDRVYEQYCELSRHWPQNWKQGEAKDKASQGSYIASPKDQ